MNDPFGDTERAVAAQVELAVWAMRLQLRLVRTLYPWWRG